MSMAARAISSRAVSSISLAEIVRAIAPVTVAAGCAAVKRSRIGTSRTRPRARGRALLARQAPRTPGRGNSTEAQGDEAPSPHDGRHSRRVGEIEDRAEGERSEGAGAEAEERSE